MKKWLAATFICSYLSVLSFGVVTHVFGTGTGSHPAMYFIVWDMFCGWSAYSNRTHVISEGVSGDYYRLSPAPWETFIPFGNLQRQHYDTNNYYANRIGANVLRHTTHEEMTRILVIEESWSKKFNQPDYIWNSVYNEPRDLHSYYRTRSESTPDGKLQGVGKSFVDFQVSSIMTDNPRLRNDARKGGSQYVVNPRRDHQKEQPDNTPLIPGLTPNAQ